MISRRNFGIITILMLIVLVIFQFSEVAKNAGNHYSVNESLDEKYPANMQYQAKNFLLGTDSVADWEKDNYILYVGDSKTNMGSVVSQWVTYTKRKMLECHSLSDFELEKFGRPEFTVIDSKYVDFEKETDKLIEMADEGMSIVFCSLPDSEIITPNEKLKKLMGISYRKEKSVTVEGIKLFSGFLFGGETIYEPKKAKEERRQDLELNVPWYITAGATKTYMVGILDEYFQDFKDKNDFFPALIWRNSYSADSQIFCVVGDYMETTAGIGILASMIYELSDYQIYPVVNAQNTLLISYPLLANENDEEIKSLYTRSYDAFQNNVIWSSLVAAQEKYKLKYTAFLTPKYNYSDGTEPELDTYVPYLTNFKEKGTEVGYSFIHDSSVDLLEKVNKDEEYLLELENRYPSTSAFMDLSEKNQLLDSLKASHTSNIRTIACDEDVQVPILSYLTDDITLQSLTSNTENFTYSRDLMLKSVETALGYDNAKLDFTKVAWPQNENEHWEKIYEDMSSSLATFWKPFRVYDRTTLSESDKRVRTFLNIESVSKRDGDVIELDITGRDNDTCYFVLRTHGYIIDSVSDLVSYKEIEDYAYLLTIDCDKVTINLKNALNLK